MVRAPDGGVSIDPGGRLPGRGAYLCRDAACWDLAGRRRALERALGVTLPGPVVAALSAGPGEDIPHPDPIAGPRTGAAGEPDTNSRQGGPHGQE